MNVCSSRSGREMKLSIMFGTIDDRIWSKRNEFIFSNKWTNTLDLVLTIWSGVRDISRSKLTHMILAPNNDNDNHNAFGRWKKPLLGTTKINYNGPYLNSVALAACGVVL